MCIIPTDFKLSNREECLVVNSKEINVMKLVKVVFVGFGRLGLKGLVHHNAHARRLSFQKNLLGQH